VAQESIDAKTLWDMLERGERVTVVDVRKREVYAAGSIPASVNFDAYDALHEGDERALAGLELPEGAPVVTVCNPRTLQCGGCGAVAAAGTRGRSAWREDWKLGRASEVTVDTLRLHCSLSGGRDLGYGVDPAVRVA
jgi:rhodanese-related sulfurtransferase